MIWNLLGSWPPQQLLFECACKCRIACLADATRSLGLRQLGQRLTGRLRAAQAQLRSYAQVERSRQPIAAFNARRVVGSSLRRLCTSHLWALVTLHRVWHPRLEHRGFAAHPATHSHSRSSLPPIGWSICSPVQ